ncbi:MAG: proteasome subunit alpha [Actinomycetota bacterium]
MPYYVSPEQFMKDKADYARKGIARGKSVIALVYKDGISFIAENPSSTLHKVSEIYDRMSFAGVGKFNEFEALRRHGIRQADIRGYSFSRDDVTGRGLANDYSQILGQIFTEAMKPYEIEILVAQVGADSKTNELFHILYDGSVADEEDFVAMGGQSEQLSTYCREHFKKDMTLAKAVKLGVKALGIPEEREVSEKSLEVAVLDRNLQRRKFRRVTQKELTTILA